MNTYKKSLLNNNGWILCPSKTFSGKMYYFNVQTGEAVWTSDDNEKFTSKRETQNIQRVSNLHNYPEPPTPPNYSPDVTPANICPSTSNVWTNHNQTSHQKSYANYANQPIFGQPPRFVPQLAPFMPGIPPNVVWTPIQLPTQRWPYWPENKKPMVDEVTQTSTPDRELFVQTSGKPLCKRFINYEVPSLKFNEKNKIINRSSNFATSTPIRNSNSIMEHSQSQVPISKFSPEPIFNLETESHSSFIEQSTDNSDKTEFCKTVQSEMPLNYCVEKPALCSVNRIQNTRLGIRKSLKKDISELHSSDLRFLLLAKRKKLEEEKNHIANKKPKLQASQTPQKKKVTFNLENENDSINVENEISTPSDQTPECKTSFFKITTSPTQTMLNYYNILEHKIPVKNNMPNHYTPAYSMPTRNIPTETLQKDMTATNENVQSCQDNMANNNKINWDMTIKRRIANNTLTDNMSTENTLNTPKYFQIKDGIQNHSENVTPILKEAPTYTPLGNDPFKSHNLARNMPDCNSATKIMPNCNPPLKESGNNEPVLKERTNSYTIKDVWYLVVDIDVLLEDLAMIDQLLMSDEKCRLLIPECIRKDIEALCIGDCRGQQRVLVARQMSRRISSTQKQYVVIPPNEEYIELTTTDALLNTCTRFINDQYYLVLITNNENLQTKAKTLNIRCYKPQQIKNGVQIRPRLFSELKKIKVTVDNDNSKEKHNIAIKNNPDFFRNDEKFIPVDMFKKQLFVNDKPTDKNCDILINITKPKNSIHSLKFNSNIDNHDESILRDSQVSKDFESQSQNADLNKVDTEKQNQNADPKIYKLKNMPQNLENIVPNPKSDTNNQNVLTKKRDHFPNENFLNTGITINTTPKTNKTKVNDNNDTNKKIQKNEEEKSTTKIIKNTVSSRTLKINSLALGNYKIPKLLPLKTRNNASALTQSSNETENRDPNFKNSVEGRLKNFFVKSKLMHEKIETRMDEWTCTYTQIMEDLLNDILQANPKYKDINTTVLNWHESLTYIKMLYKDKELTYIVELLMEMLDKCSCSKGKIKLDTTPKDFMKIIGCSILLVQACKTVLPTYEILTDYASSLDGLLTNIESKAIELDPESLRPNLESLSRLREEDTAKKARQNFLKDSTYIIEYLKKHYKEWASYDENQEKENGIQKYSPNEDLTVVRMIGKNLNRVKIDYNKCISYAKSSVEKDYTKYDETKIIKLSQNDNHSTKDNTGRVQTRSMSRKLREIKYDVKDKEVKENAGSKIIRLIENVSLNMEDENTEPNEIKKEPLDLDLLDYETSVITADQNFEIMENTDSMIQNADNYSTNSTNKKTENFRKNDSFNTNSSCFVPNMNICKQMIKNNENYANEDDNYANENDNYANKNDNYGSEVLEFSFNTTNNENDINNDNYLANDNNYEANDDNYANNQLLSRDDSTNDSGVENDCTQAHSIIKLFLMELSNTFKVIYEFITNFVKEIRGEAMCEERKNHLHVKSSRSLEDMTVITHQLRSIMTRESRGNTKLKRLLCRAETGDISDSRVRRYRQIIIKCVEQAEILENSLRSIVSITIGDLDELSNNANSISSGVKYINIFE